MFWRFKYFRMGSLGLPASTPENRFMRVKQFPNKKNGIPEISTAKHHRMFVKRPQLLESTVGIQISIQSPSHISRVCFTPPKAPWSSTKGHRCFKMSMILVCWFYVMSKTKSLVIVLQVFQKSNFAAWRSAQQWVIRINVALAYRKKDISMIPLDLINQHFPAKPQRSSYVFLWMIGDRNCKW